MKFLFSQLKVFFTNRFGLSAVFANLGLAIWGLLEKGWKYDSFHFYYEPLPIKIVSMINLPVIGLAESINRTLLPFPKSQFGSVRIDDFEMMLIVVFSIFQWLLFGYLGNLIFNKKLK